MTERAGRGQAGEDLAWQHLAERGYRLIGRNVRVPGGEIDIVCSDGETIVFVEVKLRTTGTYGTAIAAVDARKRRKLRSLAADYLQFAAPRARARFDVVTVEGTAVRHHRSAF